MGILVGLTSSQIGQLSKTKVAELTSTDIAGLTSSQILGLTPFEITFLSNQAIRGLSSTQLGKLTTSQICGLTARQLGSLNISQFNGLNSADIMALTRNQFAELNSTEIRSLSTAQIGSNLNKLSAAHIGYLSLGQLTALTSTQLGMLTASQISGLTSLKISSLGTTQIAGLTSSQIAMLSSRQFSGLNSADIMALTRNQFAGLNSTEIRSLSTAQIGSNLNKLSAAHIGYLSLGQLTALTSTQLGMLTASQISGLTSLKISSLGTTQIAGLTSSQIAMLSSRQFSGLNSADIMALTRNQFAGLNSTEIRSLSTTQIGSNLNKLSAAHIGYLSSGQLTALTSTQLGMLTTAQIVGLTSTQIGTLSSNQFAGLTSTQIGTLSSNQFAGLSSTEIRSLSTPQIGSNLNKLNAAQFGYLSTAQLTALTSAQIRTLTTTQIAGLTSAQIGALSSRQFYGFNKLDIASLTSTQFAGLSSIEIKSLSSMEISNNLNKLSAAHIGYLSTGQLVDLTSVQIGTLTTAQIAGFTPAQIGSFTSSQFSGFTHEQVKSLPLIILTTNQFFSYQQILERMSEGQSTSRPNFKLRLADGQYMTTDQAKNIDQTLFENFVSHTLNVRGTRASVYENLTSLNNLTIDPPLDTINFTSVTYQDYMNINDTPSGVFKALSGISWELTQNGLYIASYNDSNPVPQLTLNINNGTVIGTGQEIADNWGALVQAAQHGTVITSIVITDQSAIYIPWHTSEYNSVSRDFSVKVSGASTVCVPVGLNYSSSTNSQSNITLYSPYGVAIPLGWTNGDCFNIFQSIDQFLNAVPSTNLGRFTWWSADNNVDIRILTSITNQKLLDVLASGYIGGGVQDGSNGGYGKFDYRQPAYPKINVDFSSFEDFYNSNFYKTMVASSNPYSTNISLNVLRLSITGDEFQQNIDFVNQHLNSGIEIILSDLTPPRFSLTAVQIGNNLNALNKIISEYKISIVDNADNIANNIDLLRGLVSQGILTTISLYDPSIPYLTISKSQLINDADVLGIISNNFNLTIIDVAIEDIEQILQSPHVKNITVRDYVNNIASNLDQLQSEAALISSITFTDTSNLVLDVTASQIRSDAAIIRDVTNASLIKVTDTAAHLANLDLSAITNQSIEIAPTTLDTDMTILGGDVSSIDLTQLTDATYIVQSINSGLDTQIAINQNGINHTLTLAGETSAQFTIQGPVALGSIIAIEELPVKTNAVSHINDFLNVGGGDDAVNGGAGSDVLDGGTGSNFLTGGSGWDTFFIDGRGNSTTWGTIADYTLAQLGTPNEQVSIWGWVPGTSSMSWVANDGAQGYQGATLVLDMHGDGSLIDKVTFTGLTQSQIPTPVEFTPAQTGGAGLLWFK